MTGSVYFSYIERIACSLCYRGYITHFKAYSEPPRLGGAGPARSAALALGGTSILIESTAHTQATGGAPYSPHSHTAHNHALWNHLAAARRAAGPGGALAAW